MSKKNTQQIIYSLNNLGDKLIVSLPCNLDEILPCDDIIIKLGQDNNSYFLTQDCLLYLMNHLKGIFKAALKNELRLHKSINKNIGYLRNQYLYDSIEWSEGNREKESPKWLGDRYHLFSTPGRTDISLVAWLYNNKDGDIIVEITPGYKWFFNEPDPRETYVSYDEFMKDYQSLYATTIPSSFAKALLKQFDILLYQSKNNKEKNIVEENQE